MAQRYFDFTEIKTANFSVNKIIMVAPFEAGNIHLPFGTDLMRPIIYPGCFLQKAWENGDEKCSNMADHKSNNPSGAFILISLVFLLISKTISS